MRTEKILAILSLIGLLLKVFHVPGAAVLLTISLFMLLYYIFRLHFTFSQIIYFLSDKEIKRQNLALSIVAGFFLAISPIGILFKIQHWEGAHLYLSVGLAAIIILLIITYFLKSKSADNLKIYYQNLIARLMILGALTAIFYLMPIGILLNI